MPASSRKGCVKELLDLFHVVLIFMKLFCGLYPQLQKEDRLGEKSIVFNVDGTTLLLTLAFMIKNILFYFIGRTCHFSFVEFGEGDKGID